MRILLLNPPGPVLKAGTRWSSKMRGGDLDLRYYPFPFYLAYAAAVLREAGHDVTVCDAVAMEWSDGETVDRIHACKPDLLAVETTATSFRRDAEFIRPFATPKAAIGSHATGNPQTCIEAGYDYVVAGEYEYPLRDLADHMAEAKPLPPSIVDARAPHAPTAFWVEDLNTLPRPARDLFDLARYNEPVAGGRNIVLVSGRGCPMRCRFCTVPVFQGGGRWRARNPVQVADEVEYLLQTYACDELYFDDDNLTAYADHVSALCDEFKRRNLRFRWGCMGDAFVKPELFERMADAGCVLFKFGVEHNDRNVLERIPKPVKEKNVRAIIAACKEHGIRAHATFMVGLPGSSVEKDRAMIDYSLSLRPTTLQYSVYSPFPGTPAYQEAQEQGWLVSTDWTKLDGAGRSLVSYPDYHWTQITKINCLAWDRWAHHFVFRQPGTSWHHFKGILKRQGLARALRTSFAAATKILGGLIHRETVPAALPVNDDTDIVVTLAGAHDTTLKCPPGSNLLHVLVGGKTSIWHHCGGKGRCATCTVEISDGAGNLSTPSAAERELLTDEELKAGWRLACQARVNAACTVRIPKGIETS